MVKNILLHSCCSPCTIDIITKIKHKVTILFYNPNININKEYINRKKTLMELIKNKNIPFIDSDYNPKFWIKNAKIYKNLNEKNKRCLICFKIRLEYTAYIAKKYNYNYISTSLTASNKKNKSQINIQALNIINKYNNLQYITFDNIIKNKDKKVGYKQKYCGCIFSIKHI